MKNYDEIAINELKPYENNARLHSEEQIEKIINSINEFGFIAPVIIDENNMILVGHGRTEAAKRAGFEKVPYRRITHLTDEQKRAYILADNKLSDMGDWDMDMLNIELEKISLNMEQFGFDSIEEPDIDINEDGFDFDDYTQEEVKAKLGDIYQLGQHRLMCGDATKTKDVEKLMNGETADLIVTDPPYNVDYSSKNKFLNYSGKGNHIQKSILNDNIQDFELFLCEAYGNMVQSLKCGGAIYVWYAEKEGVIFRQKLSDAGVYVHQTLIWVKNSIVLGHMDYQCKHEPCLYGWKEGAGHYFVDERNRASVIEDKIDFDKLKKEEAIQMLKELYDDGISTTVIHENKPLASELHPTMKPLKLLARLINNSSRENEIVLDVFGGSGSTLMACEQLNRKCYMMELDPFYVDTIIKRFEDYTGQKAVKING